MHGHKYSEGWERQQWENRKLVEKASFFKTTRQGKSTNYEQNEKN